MESIVKDLLEELYILEPTLRKQEKQLTKFVTLMVSNIPKSEMNIEFKKELRKQILSKIHSKKEIKFSLFFPIFASISVFLFLSIFSWNYFQNMSSNHTQLWRISFMPDIKRVWSNAFGTNIKKASLSAPVRGWNYAMWIWPTAKMANDTTTVAYEHITYQYSYTGVLPAMSSGQLLVYKRESVPFTNQDTVSFIGNLNIDGINTKEFQNAGLSSINISEDREFGYNIWIDFTAWTVNFYQNYPKWPQQKCDTNGCEPLPKLTEKDIPSSESLIVTTDAFISKYGINREMYGTPQVNSSWRTEYMKQVREGSEWIIPEVYTVTYPIVLDSKNLYEESGEYKWLIFGIDIRTKKVISLTGLEKYTLKSSLYPPISRESRDKMIASWWRYTEWDANTETWKVVQLILGDPIIGYMRINGEWKDGISNDFFVPAYIFNVMNKPKDSYISDTVMIPMVEWFDN